MTDEGLRGQMSEDEFEEWLAQASQELAEDCANMPRKAGPVRTPDGRAGAFVVILERVVTGVKPPYAIFGFTECHWCDEMCWVGTSTQRPLENGAKPMCQPCGSTHLPASGAIPTPTRFVDE